MCIRDSFNAALAQIVGHERAQMALTAEAVAVHVADVNGIDVIDAGAVSYTHLTLPTSDLVEVSVVAVSFKKKKKNKKKKESAVT